MKESPVFPVDLIIKLVEGAAKQAGTNLTTSALATRRDTKKSFGRDLFHFYEYLKDYADTADELAACIRRLASNVNPFEFDGNLDQANRRSARLSEIVGDLLWVLWPGVRDAYGDVAERRPRERAMHRARVLSIFDPQLMELVDTEYQTDMTIIYLARQINELYFDRHEMAAYTFLPTDGDLEPILGQVGHQFITRHDIIGRKYGGGSDSDWRPPEAFSRISLTDDPERIAELASLIDNNVRSVRVLRESLACTLRVNFSIEDLL